MRFNVTIIPRSYIRNECSSRLIGQNPALINSANYLMWASHNLERMADRVTNICERTVFMATGMRVELDVLDSEQPFN